MFDRHAFKKGVEKGEANAEDSALGRIASALERIATVMESDKCQSAIYNGITEALFSEWQRTR